MTTTLPQPLATQLRNEIEYGHNGMVRKFLVKDQKWQAMLICLHAGIRIPEHTSSYDSFLTVIQGRGVFLLAGREVVLEPGVFIELPANTLHALTVIKNLAMLKVVDAHESKELPEGMKKTSGQEQSPRNPPKPETCAGVLAEMLKLYLQGPSTLVSPLTETLQNEPEP